MRNDFLLFAGETRLQSLVEYTTPFVDSITNIKASNNVFANATTHQWGIDFDADMYSQCVVTPVLFGVTLGDNIFSLNLMPQVYDTYNNLWINYPNMPIANGQLIPASALATGISLTGGAYTAIATGTYGLNPISFSNFGGRVRFGLSMANTSTGAGSITVSVQFKI